MEKLFGRKIPEIFKRLKSILFWGEISTGGCLKGTRRKMLRQIMNCPAKLKFFPVPQFIVRVVKVLFKSDLYISPLSSYIIVHIMIINFEGTLLFHDLDFMFQINNTVYSLNKNYIYP